MEPLAIMNVHPLLCDRSRLAIMVYLLKHGQNADFNTLLAVLKLTKGNLASHLRKLEEGELLVVKKEFVERKPRTSYALTNQGRKVLKSYLSAIQEALSV